MAAYKSRRNSEAAIISTTEWVSREPGWQLWGSKGKGEHPENPGTGEVDHAEWEECQQKFPRGTVMNRKPSDSYVPQS